MTELIISNISLDLGDDFSLKIVEKSSLFSWQMVGGFTLPFGLPKTAKNRAVFGYVDSIQVIAKRDAFWPVKIKENGLEIFEGTLRISSIDELFNCEMAIPPANIAPEIWEKSLRTFDFGSDTLASEMATSNFWSVEILESEVKYFGVHLQNLNTYQVYINGALNFEFKNFDGHTDTDKLAARATSLEYNFNNERNPTYYLFVSNKGFGLRGAGITSAKISYKTYEGGEIGPGTTVTREWELVRVTYKKLKPVKISDYLNKPYAFNTIRNDAFYDKSVNTFWNGRINLVEGGILKFNTEDTLTAYTVVPFMRLKYVLEKIASLLGYKLTGSFISHPNAGKILIYTNISSDYQCENAFVPFNIHKDVITYADYLPALTLKEFLEGWKSRLGVDILFDYAEKTMSINLVNSVLESNQKQNWRDKLPDDVHIEPAGSDTYFRFDSDIYSEFELIEVNRQNPPNKYEGCLKDVNNFGTENIEGENIRTLVFPQLHIYEYYLYVQPRANGGGQGSTIQDKYYVANHRGVSTLFNQSDSAVKARIFFEEVNYVPVDWSLSFFAADGIQAKLLAKMLEILKQYKIIELYCYMNLLDIYQKNWYMKRNILLDFFLNEVSYTLPLGKEPVKIKLIG